MQRLRLLGGVFGAAARNIVLARVGLAYTAFIGAEVGVWVALLIYAYQGGGASAASVMALVQLVPGAVLAPYLGALADRHRSGRVLLAGYVCFSASMAVVAVMIAIGAPRLSVYLLAPFVNLAVCIPRPAQAALLPAIVRSPEELAAANAGQGWLESAGSLVGPVVLAVLLTVGGTELGIAGMAGLAGAAALLVLTIDGPPPFVSSGDARGVVAVGETTSGLRQVARQPAALTLVALLGGQYILMGALDLIYVVLAFRVLGMGAGGPGYLTAAFGAGGLLAILVTATLVGRRRLAPAMIAAWLVPPVALLLLSAHATRLTAVLLIVLAGVGRSAFDVAGRTLLQRTAPPELVARMFGMLESLLNIGLAVGVLLVPLLIALAGATGALVGTAVVLLAVLAAAGPRLRGLDASASVPLVEIHLLRSIPLFAALPAPTLETLARALTPVRFAAGSVIIRQGDIGDRYYAIARGELDVLRDGVAVVSRMRNEGVGEIALIREVRRTATVRARTDVELYALEREPFLLALTGHATARRSADAIVRQRLAELAAAGGSASIDQNPVVEASAEPNSTD